VHRSTLKGGGGGFARHCRQGLPFNSYFVSVAAVVALSLVSDALAQDPAVISIETKHGTALAPGISGWNAPQLRNGVEYYDPKFVAAAKPLNSGWLRFPAGTASLAYDWNPADPFGGHIDLSWMNSLISGTSPPVSGQSAKILVTSQFLTQAKGGVYLADFATFARTLNAQGIVCLNTYTDKNPGSPAQMAQAAQRNGLNVMEWELGNEADLYPAIYPTGVSYATDVHPFFKNLLTAAPTATVGLFSAGPYTGSSLSYACTLGFWFDCWDNQLSLFAPRYWNASSVHIYPVTANQTAQTTIYTLNGILAHASADYINGYLVPLIGADTPIFITEFNCCSQYGNNFLRYIYNGIFLAEYIARLSSVPQVKAVGIDSLYTDNADFHGMIQSVDDFEKYLITQVKINPSFYTNTATDLKTQFQFYMSAPGLAMEVANGAVNSGQKLLPTTTSGGLTVDILGFDGQPIPAIYAQAYGGSGGTHYLLITNKAAMGQNITIDLDGAALSGTLNLTYVSSTGPLAANTALSPTNVQVQTAKSANPIFVGPYSVTTVTW